MEKINELGGCNINKYLSYCGLISSSTEQFEFDIDRAIVINDFESEVEGEVDFIETKNETITKNKIINHKRTPVTINQFTMTGNVTRELKKIKIAHSDYI